MIRAVLSVALAVGLHGPPPPPPFHASIAPLTASMRADLREGDIWRSGCPVPLSGLRVLGVSYWDFHHRPRSGQLVVNRRHAASLAKVFRRLYELRFPIRHMRYADAYGPAKSAPDDIDISGSFDCSEAKPDPCTGVSSGNWSEHAYGEAVDINPIENPYTCGGRAYHPESEPYIDRSPLRRGMVTPEVVRAFGSIGWGWGGAWAGSTKDYTHFSVSGH